MKLNRLIKQPPSLTDRAPHRVAIVGGGFAGLQAARKLAPRALEITLVDRRNFHLFQPLVYQVATGALSPSEISPPISDHLPRPPQRPHPAR